MLLIRFIVSVVTYGSGFCFNRFMYSFFLMEKTMSIVLRKHYWVCVPSCLLCARLVFTNFSSKVEHSPILGFLCLRRFSAVETFSAISTNILLPLLVIISAYCNSSLNLATSFSLLLLSLWPSRCDRTDLLRPLLLLLIIF